MSAKHEKTKRTLKIVGIVLMAVGLVCDIVGFIDIFRAIHNESMPSVPFLLFIGLPMFGIGLILLIFGAHREIARYVKDESVPVINEASRELTPAVRAVVNAAKGETVSCPACGANNEKDNAYCSACGKPLQKICPKCGSTQAGENAYCSKCGEKL